MAAPSTTYTNPRTAEFACLTFFDRVVTRRARAVAGRTASDVISADDIANIPAEFAPVLKCLSTVVTTHTEGDCRRRMPMATIVPTKSWRNTMSGAVNVDVSEEIEEVENPS